MIELRIWRLVCVALVMVHGLPLGTAAAQQPAKLEKAREEFNRRLDLYRKAMDDSLGRVVAEVEKIGSPDLSLVFEKELAAYREGGHPPAFARTKRFQRSWKEQQDRLVKAQPAFEKALLDARDAALKANTVGTLAALDAELKLLRQNWIVAGDPASEVVLLPIADKEKSPIWSYTEKNPGLSWIERDFKGPNWKEGLAGFASKNMANIITKTNWESERIWLRRTIDVPRQSPNDIVVLRLRYDEDAELFVNGDFLAKYPGYNGYYSYELLKDNQKRLFHEGVNTIAVFCRNNGGGQAIDMGLTVYRGASDVVAATAKAARDPDLFEIGAIWEGSRTHRDPVTPGETLTLELEILQRMGNQFRARLNAKDAKGSGNRIVSGTIAGNQLSLDEPTAPTKKLTYKGNIDNKVWKYEFHGNGALGAERYGHGELHPRAAQ